MSDPVGDRRRDCAIVSAFAFDDASQQAVQRWIDDHPQDKHGVHRYTAADFGLDPDRLRARFDFYTRRFL